RRAAPCLPLRRTAPSHHGPSGLCARRPSPLAASDLPLGGTPNLGRPPVRPLARSRRIATPAGPAAAHDSGARRNLLGRPRALSHERRDGPRPALATVALCLPRAQLTPVRGARRPSRRVVL